MQSPLMQNTQNLIRRKGGSGKTQQIINEQVVTKDWQKMEGKPNSEDIAFPSTKSANCAELSCGIRKKIEKKIEKKQNAGPVQAYCVIQPRRKTSLNACRSNNLPLMHLIEAFKKEKNACFLTTVTLDKVSAAYTC